MLPPTIAVMARDRGLDITSSHELGLNSAADDAQLAFATNDGRCLVTRNYDDSATLTTRSMEHGEPHAGVVFVPTTMPDRHTEAIVDALVHLMRQYPDGLPPYTILWLTPAR